MNMGALSNAKKDSYPFQNWWWKEKKMIAHTLWEEMLLPGGEKAAITFSGNKFESHSLSL